MMRKDAVVVTGSSGFVGTALIEKLALHFMLGASIGAGSITWELRSDLCQLRTKATAMSGRDAAMVNGALIALGILGIVDN